MLDGGSATQGALPLLALAERGYKGKLYGNPALVNADFVRVGGKAAEGIQVSTGPVIVADQLPKDHYAREPSLAFRTAFQKANGAPTTDAFSAYAFDAWLIMTDAAKRAMANGAKPGTPEFREALNDAIFSTKELPGHGGDLQFHAGIRLRLGQSQPGGGTPAERRLDLQPVIRIRTWISTSQHCWRSTA